MKFQSVLTPNGIIANMFGPVGRYFFKLFYTFPPLCILGDPGAVSEGGKKSKINRVQHIIIPKAVST